MSAETLPTISIQDFKKHLLAGKPIIDVRAPVEFSGGAIPGSVNLPILGDEERALVGTCYKKHGQEKAVTLGYQLVSGENKNQKLDAWVDYTRKHPDVILTCFRGGQRSQITQTFLREQGISLPRIEKGYKQVRQFFIEELADYSANNEMILLTGLTGSAKTHLLQSAQSFYPAINLEDLAKHRGSAFGHMKMPQPSQADFENMIATEVLRWQQNDRRPILFEDESRLIGHRHLPENFFEALRRAPVIVVKQNLEQRIENIFKDYITDAQPDEALFFSYENSLRRIERRLGGLKTSEILNDLLHSKKQFLDHRELSPNRAWIEKLLLHYYDPMYRFSFDKRNPAILFQGTHAEILDFLKAVPQSGRE